MNQVNPMMAAIQAARSKSGSGMPSQGMAPGDPNMTMPMGEDKETGTLLLDRSLFKEVSVKDGDEITVTGKVTAIGGNKIGFSPSTASKVEEEGEPLVEFDADLDGDMPPSTMPKV